MEPDLKTIIEEQEKGFFEKLKTRTLSEPMDLFTDKEGFIVRHRIKDFDIVTRRHDYIIEGKPSHNYWTFIYNPNKCYNIPADTILDIEKNNKFEKAIETHFKAKQYFGKI